jgi:ribonuclease HII
MVLEKNFLPFFDQSFHQELISANLLVAGVDEVGRGSLFGPVVAAAVVFPSSLLADLAKIVVRDSKLLSVKQRHKLAAEIKTIAHDFQVGYSTVCEIDQLNILQASLLAMKRSVLKLKLKPQLCLVDGSYSLSNLDLPQITLIKGDQRSPIIAAASIVAKVWRDELIVRWDTKYPHYDLVNNKGYGTKKHLIALSQFGPSSQHRLSFRPCQISR